MPLETGTTIAELNELWPLGSDPKSEGDDHLRLIKSVLQNDAVSKDADVVSTDIVVANAAAGWQIWGDTLLQWGSATTPTTPNIGRQFVAFLQPFKGAPAVTVTAHSAASNEAVVAEVEAGSLVETGFAVTTEKLSGGAPARGPATVTWIAVGEAPDAVKKPKSVSEVS